MAACINAVCMGPTLDCRVRHKSKEKLVVVCIIMWAQTSSRRPLLRTADAHLRDSKGARDSREAASDGLMHRTIPHGRVYKEIQVSSRLEKRTIVVEMTMQMWRGHV
jgi:hypothetical protein